MPCGFCSHSLSIVILSKGSLVLLFFSWFCLQLFKFGSVTVGLRPLNNKTDDWNDYILQSQIFFGRRKGLNRSPLVQLAFLIKSKYWTFKLTKFKEKICSKLNWKWNLPPKSLCEFKIQTCLNKMNLIDLRIRYCFELKDQIEIVSLFNRF